MNNDNITNENINTVENIEEAVPENLISISDCIERIDSEIADEQLRDNIITYLKALKVYTTLDMDSKLLKTNLPIGTIVYMCTVETVNRSEDQNPESEENLPLIIQKPFVPGTVYFEMLNNAAGQFVFTHLSDAISFINSKMGDDICRKYNFPTFENGENGELVLNDNGSDMIDAFAVFDSRIDEEFMKNIIHTEVAPEDYLGLSYKVQPVETEDTGACAKCECDHQHCDCDHSCTDDECISSVDCDGVCEDCNHNGNE